MSTLQHLADNGGIGLTKSGASAGLVLGVALTVWTVLLFALPLMVVLGLIATWLQFR